MVDVSTPHDGSKSSFEIISSEHNVSKLLSSRASTSHSESNISSIESFNISNASSSDENLLVVLWEEFLKSFNYNSSMFWGSFGKYFKFTKDSGKCSLVLTLASGFIELLSMHDNTLMLSLRWISSLFNLTFSDETNLQCNSLSSW